MAALDPADPRQSQRVEKLDGLVIALSVSAGAGDVSARVAERPQAERSATPGAIRRSTDGADLFRKTCCAAESLEERPRQLVHSSSLSRRELTYTRVGGTAQTYTRQCVVVVMFSWAIPIRRRRGAVDHLQRSWRDICRRQHSRNQRGCKRVRCRTSSPT